MKMRNADAGIARAWRECVADDADRGEGGQNKVGSNLSDVLGVLRTLELLAADEYYGVQERFSRVADFGFSKSPDETFAKWADTMWRSRIWCG